MWHFVHRHDPNVTCPFQLKPEVYMKKYAEVLYRVGNWMCLQWTKLLLTLDLFKKYDWWCHHLSQCPLVAGLENIEFCPNQNLFNNISTSYLTFSPQVSFPWQKCLTAVLKKMPMIIKSVLRVAHQRSSETTLRILHYLFQQTLILRPLLT